MIYTVVSSSYKLWYAYLKQRRKQVKRRCVTDPAFEEVNNCHERALVFMHKVKTIYLQWSACRPGFSFLIFCIMCCLFRCPAFGWITASSSWTSVKLPALGERLTGLSGLFPLPSTIASGPFTYDSSVHTPYQRPRSGSTGGT